MECGPDGPLPFLSLAAVNKQRKHFRRSVTMAKRYDIISQFIFSLIATWYVLFPIKKISREKPLTELSQSVHTIPFNLTTVGNITVELLAIAGRQVDTLLNA